MHLHALTHGWYRRGPRVFYFPGYRATTLIGRASGRLRLLRPASRPAQPPTPSLRPPRLSAGPPPAPCRGAHGSCDTRAARSLSGMRPAHQLHRALPAPAPGACVGVRSATRATAHQRDRGRHSPLLIHSAHLLFVRMFIPSSI